MYGFRDFSLDMCRCWTVSGKPFAGGFRIDLAVLTGLAIDDSVATSAFFNNCVTASSIKSAPFLGHKGALSSSLDGLTNHGNHPPFIFVVCLLSIKPI